ncbi:uncharacterized protein KY384_008315 [Bacidia gigantensis]|uniref:uncharacterized protein n=1 Tax=Bacidia gigantensis TaxID=2732470 RepID=UPI001D05BF55|nr:uncharacterized protein KY384_008315 [Bacidia gigantensis]KAG8526886.1 hypothetical protein KY384_008315 [Bacidia gigantensis]
MLSGRNQAQTLHEFEIAPETSGHKRYSYQPRQTNTPSRAGRTLNQYQKSPLFVPKEGFVRGPKQQQQYAFPSGISNLKDDASEHMLRRKTPNGTLAAGYDGRPIEWMSKPPAPKHVLMPASGPAQGTSLMLDFPPQISNTISCRPPQSFAARAESLQGSGDFLYAGNWSHGTPMAGAQLDANVNPNAPPAGGMDSVLHQSSLHTHPFNTVSNQSVPTVLQPMWPPCLGPTSLQAPGPFGPYWPNGAFEPYRPAPLRDFRLDNNACSPAMPQLAHEQTVSNQRCRLSSLPGGRDLSLDHQGHSHGNNDVVQTSNGSHNSSLPHDFYSKLAIEQGSPAESTLLLSDNKVRVRTSEASAMFEERQPSFALASGQAQFKERILQWAYRTYCGLLASIESARRDEQSSKRLTAVPKSYAPMPRRPYPSWSSKHRRSSSDSVPANASYTKPLSHGNVSSHFGSLLEENDCATKNNVKYLQTTPYLVNEHDKLAHGDASVRGWQPQSQHFRLSAHTQNPSYVPARLTQHPTPASPAAAAVNAMEILSKLCQESNWQWADGMLLNGCLAYGLGEYSKATKWYLKVLRQDANNVEAMSNLAATLLALGQRREAEQHWMRSIQLRPSYFEAVEHLVGLLHEEHRGREAVALIDYIESALVSEVSSNVGHQEDRYSDSHHRSGSYAIPSSDNGRLLALVHGKGNVLYQSGENDQAAKAFEDAILIGTGQYPDRIRGLIGHILRVFSEKKHLLGHLSKGQQNHDEPALLPPETALETARLVFPPNGNLPGLETIPQGMGQKAAVSIISNSLLSLAKIYQDGMSSSGASATSSRATTGVQEILVLYYLSLSLQPSPSTANNVGILLAGVQQSARTNQQIVSHQSPSTSTSGVTPGSGVALALAYYDYGLKLDPRHTHLYTNLGSLFKDIGQLSAAIKMYEKAVECDGNFDIALANLANAVKDKGGIKDAIHYYKRAVASNPDFAEAVCGLANALNSVCSWTGRGGIGYFPTTLDRWHVDEQGILYDSKACSAPSSGWMERVVAIVGKQLREGRNWGQGVLKNNSIDYIMHQLHRSIKNAALHGFHTTLHSWAEEPWEGAKVVRMVERATRLITWQLYQEKHGLYTQSSAALRIRPRLPAALAVPSAPTVLPFHTFTCPLSAKQIRQISQRNGLRVSCTTLRAPWLPNSVYEPPEPPKPQLNVGYISSDFNNHPLAHLMQSVFGMHNPARVKATCYATTTSDGSVHRNQIERESPTFYDASSWSIERLVNQVVADGIHILVNLNGYTRGAKNEVFAARAAPIQMSFMGFAGTLGAEWCDYLLADRIAIPPNTLRPFRGNVDLQDLVLDGNYREDLDEWVYGENIIFTRDTFFCCDHRQSAPDAQEKQLDWRNEQRRRWKMRKELFPDLADDVVILGNFNQLYKIEPTTFRSWLRILSRVPRAVLWLLRFPELGEQHLRQTAMQWVGAEVASRIIFTDVAPKQQHIARARICDLFVDTPECNAHTTAADVLWSGTPLLTLPRYEHKMCARMAASILRGALPRNSEGDRAASDLIATNDEAYEEQGVELASDLYYPLDEGEAGFGVGRLVELRKLLYESRWTSALFDTRRWVRDLEAAYTEAWRRWVAREGGDIWL